MNHIVHANLHAGIYICDALSPEVASLGWRHGLADERRCTLVGGFFAAHLPPAVPTPGVRVRGSGGDGQRGAQIHIERQCRGATSTDYVTTC